MSLFKKAEQLQAYLKMGAFGEAGSGKTFTLALVAIGLHRHIKSTKPVCFIDSESGSDYIVPLFKAANIELLTIKSRSFNDLLEGFKEAQAISDICQMDSLTHFWNELQEAFKKKNNVKKLEFQHWNILKPEWNRFTTEYLNAPIHALVAGRSKDDYEYVASATDPGKKELQKTGTRMATEKNMSYEPSLLVEMEKIMDPKTGFWTPRAWILKDRFNQIDGKAFDKPTFETFLPHIQMLNLGGKHEGVNVDRSSQALFSSDDGQALAEIRRKQRIWTEEIESTLVAAYPGQSAPEKQKKLELLKMAFGGYSWEMIQTLQPERLQEGLLKIREAITVDVEKLAANGTQEKSKAKEKK